MSNNPFLPNSQHCAAIGRRIFLAQLAALSSFAVLPLPKLVGAAPNQEPWHTLAAVQNHLFPTTIDGPGAKEINATGYLYGVLAGERIDPESRRFIKNGVGWLEEISKQRLKKEFIALNSDQKEQVLRTIANSKAGENWLSTLLLYIFEALLSDPVYGGNPEGIGWQWLGHQPGFPRPTENKGYV